jgi:hypothetical protein
MNHRLDTEAKMHPFLCILALGQSKALAKIRIAEYEYFV